MKYSKINKCLCDNCSKHCCSHKFIGMSNALKREDKNDFVQIILDKNEVKRIVDAGYKHLIIKKDNNYYMDLNADNSCKAFINGKCSIYNVRPNVCKLYPFYFDPFCGLAIDKNCPGNFNLKDCDKEEIFEILQERIDFFKQ